MSRKMGRVFLLGAGGHAKRCIDIFNMMNVEIGGIFDDSKTGIFYHKYSILGTIDSIDSVDKFLTEGDSLFCCIGDNKARLTIFEKFRDYNFINCISPLARISPSAELGTGNFVGDYANLSSDSRIGSFNIINDNAIFNHDCVMGDYNHISLTTCCGGGVQIGNGNLIGINASINPRVVIGNWNVIGSGTVVLYSYSVSDGKTLVGNPARVIRC